MSCHAPQLVEFIEDVEVTGVSSGSRHTAAVTSTLCMESLPGRGKVNNFDRKRCFIHVGMERLRSAWSGKERRGRDTCTNARSWSLERSPLRNMRTVEYVC